MKNERQEAESLGISNLRHPRNPRSTFFPEGRRPATFHVSRESQFFPRVVVNSALQNARLSAGFPHFSLSKPAQFRFFPLISASNPRISAFCHQKDIPPGGPPTQARRPKPRFPVFPLLSPFHARPLSAKRTVSKGERIWWRDRPSNSRLSRVFLFFPSQAQSPPRASAGL
jgi:hypothetical protein